MSDVTQSSRYKPSLNWVSMGRIPRESGVSIYFIEYHYRVIINEMVLKKGQIAE